MKVKRILRKAAALILVFALLTGIFPGLGIQTAYAAAGDSPSDPILIYSAADLDNVRNGLNKHYKLMADINLGVAPYNTGSGWVPIGTYTTPFTGSIDGNGYKITNLYINRSDSCQGLIGCMGTSAVPGGTLTNLKLESVNVSGSNGTGGLVGYAYGSTATKATITGCSVSGTVTGSSHGTGGLVGYITYGIITNSSATGAVAGGDNIVGGLAGDATYTDISTSFASANVTQNRSVGTHTGGFIGRVAETTITNCYATGNVGGGDYSYRGTFIGYTNGGTLTFTNCYAAGTAYTSGLGTGYGFVNSSAIGTYTNCFYNNSNTLSGKVTALSTTDLRNQSKFTGFDFSSVWAINSSINGGYPFLQGNMPSGAPQGAHPLTAAVAPGSTFFTTKATITGAAAHHFVVTITSDNLASWPLAGDTAPSTGSNVINPYTSGADIANNIGVNKYINIYDVDANGKVVGFCRALLSSDKVNLTPAQAGTAGDPVLISSAEQLDAVRYLGLNKYYKLAADINLGVAPYNTGSGWAPIGTYTTPFTGSIDGNGYKITNLYINRSEGASGLIGYLGTSAAPGGTLTNLKLESVNVSGWSSTGGLVGSANGATITGCSVSGTVTGGSVYTGGLVGIIIYGIITNSSASGTVAGGDNIVGGLAGGAFNTDISTSFASANVTQN